MQTPILSVQTSNSNAAPAAKAGGAAGAPDNGDFQRTLNRQIEQRQAQNRAAQAQTNAPAPARQAAPA
uniref:hypothetical protein n=1 Tax=Janthinobacterium sp. TaxID=1871054 RepID=UPI00293D6153